MPPSFPTDSDESIQRDCAAETNIESIRALEEQIKEHEMAIVKLKRARNSLLNVSKLPPEILGDIFRWNVHRKTNFSRLPEKSHNFLFVCHHWFEVASCTPELWSFWGDNLGDWNKRYLRYPTAPLDLVFNGGRFTSRIVSDDLRGALRDRAARDTVRTIHLTADESDILDSVISSLAGWEGIQSSSVESVVIQDDSDDTSVDMSDFLAYYRFPKLRRLKLENCTISSWDLMSRTSVLTTLTLDIRYPSPAVTSSQILSILESNPLLRKLSLYERAVPGDSAGKRPRVSLPHLRGLALGGPTANVLQLLYGLNHPGNMDSLILNLFDSAVEDISDFVGPYLRDYLRRRGRSKNGLSLYLSSEDIVEFRIDEVAGDTNLSAPGPLCMDTIVEIVIHLDQIPLEDLLEEALLDLISYVPRTEVVRLRVHGSPIPTEVISAQLTYLKALYFEFTPLHLAFPKSNHDWDELFPHLQHVTLDSVFLRRGDWTPLTAFLECLASAGRQLDTLEIDVSHEMHPKVTEKIENAVREFRMMGTGVE